MSALAIDGHGFVVLGGALGGFNDVYLLCGDEWRSSSELAVDSSFWHDCRRKNPRNIFHGKSLCML